MNDSSLRNETPLPQSPRLQAGTPEFRRAVRAFFCGGFATFSTLYGMQPLLPLFSAEFQLPPAAASGVISASTAMLALMLIPAALLSDHIGRKSLMCAALGLAVLCSFACIVAGNYPQLLILRALVGFFLAGLPSIAMTYIGEETDPQSLARTMGIYIAGNALGGMSGRFIAGVVADHFGWRWAVAVLALIGLFMAIEFWRSLPPSRHFRKSRHSSQTLLPLLLRDAWTHASDKGMRWLFASGFLLAGCFVSLYNYLGYHLLEDPFHLSHSLVGAIFLLYLVGVVASTLAGRLAGRLGRHNVLLGMAAIMGAGLILTVFSSLVFVIPGVGLFTFGFFGAHAIASGWVSHRPVRARALASALYLCSYYLGASLIGSFSGLMWAANGWYGVAATLGLLLLVCFVLAWRLRGFSLREKA
ncbi:MAG: MFS transporter [Betaproteobacteria bacterium]|nr:MFS transporter [Betaproteobacteria bacterium]